MTLTLADRTRNFWCASFFLRRAPDRDPSHAVKALEQVKATTRGAVMHRAAKLLKEIDGTDNHASR